MVDSYDSRESEDDFGEPDKDPFILPLDPQVAALQSEIAKLREELDGQRADYIVARNAERDQHAAEIERLKHALVSSNRDNIKLLSETEEHAACLREVREAILRISCCYGEDIQCMKPYFCKRCEALAIIDRRLGEKK